MHNTRSPAFSSTAGPWDVAWSFDLDELGLDGSRSHKDGASNGTKPQNSCSDGSRSANGPCLSSSHSTSPVGWASSMRSGRSGHRGRRRPPRPSAPPRRPHDDARGTAPDPHRGLRRRAARVGNGIPVAEGDALVVATSGTSGQPKGVVLTHDAISASARQDRSGSASTRRAHSGSPACHWHTSVGSPSSRGRSSRGPPCWWCPASRRRLSSRWRARGERPTWPWSRRHCRGSIPRSSPVCSSAAARPPRCPPTERRVHLRHDRDRLGHRLRRRAPRGRRDRIQKPSTRHEHSP